MVKINNLLTVEHELSKFLFKDPVAGVLLWYFLLDHPGEEGNGSTVSVQELANKLGFTRRVIQKRIEYLEEKGFISSMSPEFYGGQRLPSIYQINFDSEFFIKTVKRRAVLKEESPDINQMIEMFTKINKDIHGEVYEPTTQSQRGKWVKGAERILKLKVDDEPFSMEAYKKVVTFLAHQMKEYIDTKNTYAMRCRDLGNLVHTDPRQTECKYIRAFRKQSDNDNTHITDILKEKDGQEYTPVSSGVDNSLWAPL